MAALAATPAERLYRSLVERAVPDPPEAKLRRVIVDSALRPGDRLPGEHELAEAVGGSRVVVRKGLHALEALGLLESRAGSGWYVRAFDVTTASRAMARTLAFHPSAVLDLLSVWRPVEADLARSLPAVVQPADLDALGSLAGQMQANARLGLPFWTVDGRFHRRLVASAGNLLALTLVDVFWNVKAALYEAGFPQQTPDDARHVADAHAEVVRALRLGDGEGAARLLRAHHDEAEARFKDWIRSHPGGDSAAGEPYGAAVRAALLLHAAVT